MYAWHMALHAVTGSMALTWTRASADDLRQWAQELKAVATSMEAAAGGEQPLAEALEKPKMPDELPGWILEATDL
jgi:hypothetical protein